MWLNRNTKLLDSFPPQKWEVKACSMWSGYSVFKFIDSQPCLHDKHKLCPHHTRQKNYGLHTIARVHNITHANCSTWNYIFQKQTGNCSLTRLRCHKFWNEPYLSNQAIYSIRPKSQDKNFNILKPKKVF